MNPDLFLAILAMDVYNRGYGSSINDLDEAGMLGNAVFRDFALGEQNGRKAKGFSAIAYDVTMVKDADGMRLLSDSDQVISYRGTDRHFALSY